MPRDYVELERVTPDMKVEDDYSIEYSVSRKVWTVTVWLGKTDPHIYEGTTLASTLSQVLLDLGERIGYQIKEELDLAQVS
jgi:hypothetical protein